MPSPSASVPSNSRVAELKAALSEALGPEAVSDDEALLRLHSEDICKVGPHLAALVVTPRSVEQIATAIRVARAAGFAVAPRGAGMSYTGAQYPLTADAISLDMAAMDRILSIRGDDMTVTVEPGCTWAALHAALKPLGLRTPFWGPMSGLVSTIGGGLSQLNAMLGAGHHGTSSESVVSLTMVLGDGSILRTGAITPEGNPFYRHYGPDLTGLFCGDSGTLGIKAEITLRLIKAPQFEDYASFSFPTGEALMKAMAEIARSGVAAETCAFDPGLTRVRMKRASLTSDVKTLGAVVTAQKSFVRGLIEAAKVALGGRNFIAADDYPLHVICEGRSAGAVAGDMADLRRIAAAGGGTEIENTIAKVIRAIPFPPLNSILGPSGELWLPVHGMVALSKAHELFAALQILFAELAPAFEANGVSTGYLFTSVSTNAITIEPVFYWSDARRPIQEVSMEPSHLARLAKLPPNPAVAALVDSAKKRVIGVFESFGCCHFQIGRTYPYRESRDAASKTLLDGLKALVDPDGAFNPGGIGFPINPERAA